MAKTTFGFSNINGRAFDIKVLETPNGWPAHSTLKNLREYIVEKINDAGRNAKKLTKTPNWSPRLTGKLINSIDWIEASGSGRQRILSGALTVSVPYGRRQEFEHKTRGRYLARAIERAQRLFVRHLRDKNVMEDIIFGRRKQASGGGVVGGQRF